MILSNSTDYDELNYVWKAWRDNTGKLMLNDYEKYVDLVNKAAKANGMYLLTLCPYYGDWCFIMIPHI